jgi:K+-sensing histidine kinase KdpD
MGERAQVGVRVTAVAGPIAVAAAASLVRGLVANTSAALVLVLVIVAVGVAGDRVAGVLAALSAAATFDFFLTVPFYRFAIFDREDVETAVLLLAIGIAVTEISQWGRRQQSQSGRREGYLTGVARAARMAADGSPRQDLVATVERVITDVLDLDDTRFEPSATRRTDRPVLDHEGAVHWRGHVVDIAREGLPTMDVIEMPAGREGGDGRFLLTASSRVRRPSREQLLVAVTLAEQVLTAPVGREPPRHR